MGKVVRWKLVEKIHLLVVTVIRWVGGVMEFVIDVRLVEDWWSLEKRTYGDTQVGENERQVSLGNMRDNIQLEPRRNQTLQ